MILALSQQQQSLLSVHTLAATRLMVGMDTEMPNYSHLRLQSFAGPILQAG